MGYQTTFFLSLLIASAQYCIAQETALNDSALSIIEENDLRNSGFVDFEVEMTMTLTTQTGNISKRNVKIRQIEIENEGDRSLLVINSPRAIRGTALLSHAHKLRDDDQWIFLPAVNRVKKIASRNKSGPFLGSDFAYEDLIDQEVEKYSYRLIKEDKIRGIECWVIERTPIAHFSGYSRSEAWYNKFEYRIERIDYYDKNNRLLKTLTLMNYERYEDKFWKAHDMIMKNSQTGKTTQLQWADFRFNNGFIPQRDFSRTTLQRSR